MKKLLSYLLTIFLTNPIITSLPIIQNHQNQLFNSPHSLQKDKLFLKVPQIVQIGADYCVAASLISLFSFWGWEKDKTQSQIYQEARAITKTPTWETGIRANKDLANYINDFIQKTTGKEADYKFNGVDISFGVSLDDIAIFSTYVWNSLSLNTPIIMGIHPNRGLGHAVVLCGYEEDLDNHWFDKYLFMDPTDGKFYEVIAQDLHKIFKYGFKLLGHGNMIGINNGVSIDISAFNDELKSIAGDNKPIFIDEVTVNLTQNVAISDLSYFSTAFSSIDFPSFRSEIKKVNDDPDIRECFGISTSLLPNTNVDYWKSENKLVHAYSEVIGCETIRTWISVTILINRSLNNDLTLSFRFYGGAKVTKNNTLQEIESPYELTGRIKIISGPNLILRRNLEA
ncbi:papain like cysteine protease AvrRpt2 [Entomoplasma freundtii]|uniref:Uncharacterized protein n=1 Tax=Entomoplasma freundtii TaxID=74700 RepID=A0A2K8NQP0_9MOLU|nr:papain-like cysteine protease family protein [Entomoplasma freundtii]ATZ16150.1 hypothetical protein EFREU_v1c01230 [Entomoplasma freundtii]TDY56949.1 papain like cysteine protease AvrRpt2 [Entomoplasma freundtii]